MVQDRNNIGYEIILVLLKGEIHLREIARKLKEPHANVLRRLAQLREDNIVDYKQEGKNKIYFIKNNFLAKQTVYRAENYKLIKVVNKYPELSIIFEEILKKIKNNTIILFGSYSKFTANKESDIDIYIETNETNTIKNLKEINSKINGKIGNFDINSLLIKEIIKNHVILRGVENFYENTGFFE